MFQLYCGGQFFWWGEMEDHEKKINPSQVTGKLDHIMFPSAIVRHLGMTVITVTVISFTPVNIEF
jgi:hypothetical protein